MESNNGLLGFLAAKPVKILSAALVLQAVAFYSLSRGENVPLTKPLNDFPVLIGDWHMTQEGYIDKDTLDVLKADDVLTRLYGNSNLGVAANLFIAYFRSQRTGQKPHSPKNCLPGAGWVETVNDEIKIKVPGQDLPIEANHYVVARGDDKSVVVYWYQSHNRVVASEYRAQFYTMADALRYNRTDTALVRVVVPVRENRDDLATQQAVAFVQSFFTQLKEYFPNL
jgi:EpsI family protein